MQLFTGIVGWDTLPDSIELYSLVFTGCQIRYEGEMRDLSSRPAKLEDHHKRRVVDELGPVFGPVAVYTLHEQEWKRYHNT